MGKSYLKMLMAILPVIAETGLCCAAIINADGQTVYAVGQEGRELFNLEAGMYQLGQTAIQKGGPVSLTDERGTVWAVPIGEYVLVCDKKADAFNDNKLQAVLRKALPMIAQVAGGEAVIFNKQGERVLCYNLSGSEELQYKGKVSKKALEAMKTQQPVLGRSYSVNGATAVRIPLTEHIGLGFNNENVTTRQHRLYEKIKIPQQAKYTFGDIIGSSQVLAKTKSIAHFVATGNSSILISGETGTGKELFAQSIHSASERSKQPFVAMNCGALPATLIESNLFGYEEGAFTGAKRGGNSGAFEQANGGTIFLDEISEMEIGSQTRLLRVLQEKEVVRVGGVNVKKIDVRIIASTNKDLTKLIAEGKFRQDLYYRLNVVEIKIPPLRERQEDIDLLARHFVKRYNESFGKNVDHIDPKALKILKTYYWPGNVRELQNCVEHSMNMIRFQDAVLLGNHLPTYLSKRSKAEKDTETEFLVPVDELNLTEAVRKTEKTVLQNALKKAKYKRTVAAKLLGISTVTLWRKLAEHDLLEKEELAAK